MRFKHGLNIFTIQLVQIVSQDGTIHVRPLMLVERCYIYMPADKVKVKTPQPPIFIPVKMTV